MIRTILIAASAVLLAGCTDLGLPENTPEADARQAPPPELVVAVHETDDAHEPLIVDGRAWVPAGTPRALRDDELTPVGSVTGRTVYARSWDQRPYDALFVRTDATATPLEIRSRSWQTYVPVLGGGPGGHEPPNAGH